jgi:opacity protein-like surface antigen
MKILIAAASGAALFAIAAPAMAQDLSNTLSNTQVYGTLGYTHIFSDLENEDSLNALEDDEADLGAIQGRLGARFNRYFAVEGELATGIKSAKVGVPGATAKAELNHQVALYGVGYLPIAPNADLFARVGYGGQEIEAESQGISATADANSWNFGAGAQYFFDEKNGVRGEYTRYSLEDDGGDIDTLSVSYVRKF